MKDVFMFLLIMTWTVMMGCDTGARKTPKKRESDTAVTKYNGQGEEL
jgi:hypothetical protein